MGSGFSLNNFTELKSAKRYIQGLLWPRKLLDHKTL